MITQEELAKRLMHIIDLKFTLLQMDIDRSRTENFYNQQVHISDGFNIELYSKIQNQDKAINDQIKIIESDTKDLLEQVK